MGQLKNLELLRASNCSLYGHLPTALLELSQLRILNLKILSFGALAWQAASHTVRVGSQHALPELEVDALLKVLESLDEEKAYLELHRLAHANTICSTRNACVWCSEREW